MVCVCACGVVCGIRVLCLGVVVYCCVCWVVSVVCLYVWRSLARGKSPCVGSKRLRVLVQNASVCAGKTRACVEPTHGEEGRDRGSPLSRPFSLSLFLLSLFRVVLFIRSLSLSLLSLFSSLLNNHSSSRFCLCTHGSDLPECQSAGTLTHSLLGEHVRIVQETTVLA